jgi:hypothetical protein
LARLFWQGFFARAFLPRLFCQGFFGSLWCMRRLVWSISTEKNEFGHIWFGPESVGGLAVSDRHCVIGLSGLNGAVLLVFATVNQVLVRLWACRGQPV